jgi:hypothetical protein
MFLFEHVNTGHSVQNGIECWSKQKLILALAMEVRSSHKKRELNQIVSTCSTSKVIDTVL